MHGVLQQTILVQGLIVFHAHTNIFFQKEIWMSMYVLRTIINFVLVFYLLQKMKTAASYLLGTHDFRNFCKMDVANGVVQFIRTILEVDLCSLCSCGELDSSG